MARQSRPSARQSDNQALPQSHLGAIINVKVAWALGIEVPMSLLLNADDYIE
jgi:hypothetical protein